MVASKTLDGNADVCVWLVLVLKSKLLWYIEANYCLQQDFSVKSTVQCKPLGKLTQKKNSWKIDSCLLVLKGGYGWSILSKWTIFFFEYELIKVQMPF